MRITNSTIARNYSSNLNRNQGRLNDSMTSVYNSGRKIFSMSDNTANGVRAMSVRRSLSQLEGYKDNAKNAKSKFDMAYDTLGTIAELATSIYERYNYAMNGTNSSDEREVIAKEFENLQQGILTSSNGQYSDRYLFGGTNTMSSPFTTNEAGELMYNNVRVKDIPGANGEYAYLLEDAAYVDIGLGMTMQGSSQDVVTNSALKNTITGLGFMGYGDDNLYDTVTELINSLRADSFDVNEAGKLLNKIKDMGINVTLQRTSISSDVEYLDYTISRLEDEETALIERQDALEFTDMADSIMELEMQQYVYNAALQMGSRLLQPTLFDYIK